MFNGEKTKYYNSHYSAGTMGTIILKNRKNEYLSQKFVNICFVFAICILTFNPSCAIKFADGWNPIYSNGPAQLIHLPRDISNKLTHSRGWQETCFTKLTFPLTLQHGESADGETDSKSLIKICKL